MFVRVDTIPGCEGQTDGQTFRRRRWPRFAMRLAVTKCLKDILLILFETPCQELRRCYAALLNTIIIIIINIRLL